jgi:hypothetical protein
MTTKIFKSKRFTFISLLTGLVFGLMLVFLPYNQLPPRTWAEFGVAMLAQFALITLLGLITGKILKNTLPRPYAVSISALFYLYTASLLLVFVQAMGYVYFLLLMPIISLGIFYVSNKFFNYLAISDGKKYTFTIIGFFLLLVSCGFMGLSILRLIMSVIMR